MQQLVTVSETVADGTQYTNVIQPPARLVGHPTLVAVTAARVTADSAGETEVLDPGTEVDLTDRVLPSQCPMESPLKLGLTSSSGRERPSVHILRISESSSRIVTRPGENGYS
jgi:hypothetical protein